MLIRDFLKLAYTTKKGVYMNKRAITFMINNNLKEDMDVSEKELILLSQNLSSKDKRVEIVTVLLEGLSCGNNQPVSTWRKRTYKQVAKELHPDSELGNNDDFQFLQEIKEFLWDCDGVPREKIKFMNWKDEKDIKNNTQDEEFFGFGF